ncbi:monooxygenase [Prauserella marina]|uniref:3-hydroxy-9,10-secoandrosta-1,3,5(10)-triene-9,17-dione monooxygenase reductase component n=1 Tax=Prauserella marina TaxID=530584 RepID=A0A222VND4_9PSEU|nr:3-hydroxy-9,10-secoandrosta-1,3,5(10)-triene-9,17-dione monooxygenase reductase subunit [Prauserella marina]ASR35435.1 monooxygenase [Prauserella marina]PWV84756.1 3-hydroxy-9,10-secoandrosta-1,3,5(10)-triene-9,17-dione monooxygenase reductase component [Prauserella marina]SDC13971.1 3-hydroxy-9,10-secoandrosta-1,3,5(10)-triene-9,17-dione monooxygenase reductase component [Prauserella marina]
MIREGAAESTVESLDPGGEVVDPAGFRSVLGHFCTGVTIVTAADDEGRPAGFACQSFAALSLDPPLVLFCPAKGSRTWPLIERIGRFAVNVLADDQRELSARFGRSAPDKFDAVPWRPAPSGAPLLGGALTWVDCRLDAVHEAGDHYVVVGRVTALGAVSRGRPLLFYRGTYTVTEQESPPGVPAWPRPDDWF